MHYTEEPLTRNRAAKSDKLSASCRPHYSKRNHCCLTKFAMKNYRDAIEHLCCSNGCLIDTMMTWKSPENAWGRTSGKRRDFQAGKLCFLSKIRIVVASETAVTTSKKRVQFRDFAFATHRFTNPPQERRKKMPSWSIDELCCCVALTGDVFSRK